MGNVAGLLSCPFKWTCALFFFIFFLKKVDPFKNLNIQDSMGFLADIKKLLA